MAEQYWRAGKRGAAGGADGAGSGVVLAVRSGNTRLQRPSIVPHWSLSNAVFWSGVFFAFSAIEAVSAMGDEIQNPRRTIPWALLVAGCILALGYIGGTTALLVALPSEAVGGPDGFVNGMRAAVRTAWRGMAAGADGAVGGVERGGRRSWQSFVDGAAAVCGGRRSLSADGCLGRFIRAIERRGWRSPCMAERASWWRCWVRRERPCAGRTTCWSAWR